MGYVKRGHKVKRYTERGRVRCLWTAVDARSQGAKLTLWLKDIARRTARWFGTTARSRNSRGATELSSRNNGAVSEWTIS